MEPGAGVGSASFLIFSAVSNVGGICFSMHLTQELCEAIDFSVPLLSAASDPVLQQY